MRTAWRLTWKSMAKITIWSLYLTLVGIPIGTWMNRRLFGRRSERRMATAVARAHVGGWPGYRTGKPVGCQARYRCRAGTSGCGCF